MSTHERSSIYSIFILQAHLSTHSHLTMNTTSYNDSSSVEQSRYNVPVNCSIVALSLASIICNSFALKIISKCKKTAYQLRFLSCNLLSSYIVVECVISLHSIALLLVDDIYHRLLLESRIVFCSIIVAVLWGSFCAVTVERLIALKAAPLKYKKYVTKVTLSISVIILWLLNMFIPLTVLIITGVKVCAQYNFVLCDIYTYSKPVRLVLLSFSSLYALIIIIAYPKVLSIVFRRHNVGETFGANTKYLADLYRKQKYNTSTRTIAGVILAAIILQAPFFVHIVILDFVPELREPKWREILQLIDYVGYQLNTYVTIYLYLWQFKECKMQLLFMLSKLNNRYQGKAVSMRNEVYGIVLKETNSIKRESAV